MHWLRKGKDYPQGSQMKLWGLCRVDSSAWNYEHNQRLLAVVSLSNTYTFVLNWSSFPFLASSVSIYRRMCFLSTSLSLYFTVPTGVPSRKRLWITLIASSFFGVGTLFVIPHFWRWYLYWWTLIQANVYQQGTYPVPWNELGGFV